MDLTANQALCLAARFAVLLIALTPPIDLIAEEGACLTCHRTTESLTGNGIRADSLVVFPEQRQHSSHSGFDCVSCHSDLAGVAEFPHAEKLAKVDCGSCHGDVAATYQWHGNLQPGVGEDIPTCAGCHGSHDILPSADRRSQVNSISLPRTCGRCHEDLDLVKKHKIPLERPIEVFESSVHSRVAHDSMHLAATCIDCHSIAGTAHQILSGKNPESSINHFNIPRTCGACHESIEVEYRKGIHGQRMTRGEAGAPVCTDCHGEHGILAPGDPRSPVSPSRVAEATCVPCHESARLNEKYAVPTGRLKTWVDSYHGLKSRDGDVTVANCASCHGGHRILPSTDPASSIHPENLQATCGQCHPGISSAAASAPIHGAPGVSRTPAAGIVRNIYIVLIVACIGGMLAYVFVDWRKHFRLLLLREQVERMSRNAVWQHAFLILTFSLLVITGFALRFSEAWWVRILFGWEGGFPLRGTIHRICAILLILTALWHVGYLLRPRGRQFLSDIMPRGSDFKQFREMISYNLDWGASRPQFGRFSYVEKIEYWALVWGTIIMAVSGLVLWMEPLMPNVVPRGIFDVMLVIHYYEAWLATLAVLIWHLYSTVFSPAVYPMNPAWLTGRMPIDSFRHEHPADSNLASPVPEESSADGEVPEPSEPAEPEGES